MRRLMLTAWAALLLEACASQPQPLQTEMVRDAQGTAYPSNIKVWCSWPSTGPVQLMAHDCAVGGGTIGALATADRPQQAIRVSSYSAPTSANPSSASIKNDNYSPTIDVQTEVVKRGAPPNTEVYLLYGKIDRSSGKATAFVQWGEVYADKGWRFYSRASNSKGQSYELAQVSRNVSSCSRSGCVYSETYNIYLPQGDLRAGSKEGISFKIFGKNGDERIVSLSPSLIAEFNEKMAEAAKMRGK